MTELEAFAIELARAAAGETLKWFRGDHGHEDKGAVAGGAMAGRTMAGGGVTGFDPVTRADRDAEVAIRRLIKARYPEHGIIGEEYGEDRPDAEHVWVLDPIDGTRAYMAGLPLWTTLIGLRVQGRPTLGLIAQPYLDEMFVGGPGGARFMARGRSRPMQTRRLNGLNEAIIATTDPALFQGAELTAWNQVRAAARLARFGCDGYAYAMLAGGYIDLVMENSLKPWDWTALVPVIEAAGGTVTNWRGDAPDRSGQILAAGDRGVRDQAIAMTAVAAI